MSRPLRPCLLLLPALSVLVTGCSTPYSRMYSPAKSYYKAPADKTVKMDADKLLGPATGSAAGTQIGGMPPGTPPGELAPAPAMPMGEVPAADPLNMAPPPAADAPPAAPAPPAPL